jgi:hypothetical protein
VFEIPSSELSMHLKTRAACLRKGHLATGDRCQSGFMLTLLDPLKKLN